MKNCCETCKHWSELVAKSNSEGEVVAMCLAGDESPYVGLYTSGNDWCSAWQAAERREREGAA
jgi:hypothetical protein